MSTATLASELPDDAGQDIAVIGMACRFPGAASPAQFWENLRDGVESITPLSVGDMLAAGVDPAAARDPGRVAVRSAPDAVADFDAAFFGFSPRQAELTDPQHRLFLECAWEALEDAGYDPAALRSAGVFAGSSMSTYLLFNLRPASPSADPSTDLQLLIGNDKDYLATQAAYRLGVTGPALNVQTACSTSLVAVHLACQSLLDHECDLALAGGVTVRVPTDAGYQYEPGGIQSPDGRCRPFDAAAQGTVFGSGAGVVVLKRLADALAGGDVIDAVIKGSAVNNDGALKAGFTAPSEDGQAQVIAEALAVAGVDPATVGFVEAHGTATPIGDPIEVAALTRAFTSQAGRSGLAPHSCALGSVKSNLGHLESAAGIAGLIKTVLAVKHGQIPATLHFTGLNPAIDFAGTPFYVSTGLSPWPAGQGPRRAGVSAFGIGGTNAHVVVEEAPTRSAPARPPGEPAARDTARPHLLALSARSPAAVAALAGRYRDFLGESGQGAGLDLADVCWSAGVRRPDHACRIAVTGHDRGELTAALDAAARGDEADPAACPLAGAKPGAGGRVVFVFPGQGSQWAGMGRQLLAREPVFRAVAERCDEAIRRQTGWSPLAALTGDDGGKPLGGTGPVQFVLFTVQAGLAAWWRSMGVEPAAVLGHSMGEAAAAYAAGALSLDDAVRVLHQRNLLIQEVAGQGKMLATGLTPDQARDMIAGQEDRACMAIVNSPRSTVLSGDPAALEAIAARLAAQGTFHRWVSVDFASHSPQMDGLTERLARSLAPIRPTAAAVPVVSTVTGAPIDGGQLDGGYWADNLRRPVLFADATSWLAEHGHDVFVEISPHPILLPAIEDSLFRLGRPGTVAGSLRRDGDEQQALTDGLAALYRAGHGIAWDRLYPAGRFVRLPSYPWQRDRHWVDPPQNPRLRPAAADAAAPAHPLLGRRLSSPLRQVQFDARLNTAELPWLNDHQVRGRRVFPGAGSLEMLARAAAWDGTPRVVTDVALADALDLSDGREHRVQTVVTPGDGGQARLELFGWDDDTGAWRVRVTAAARPPRPDSPPETARLDELRARCPREITAAEFYRRLRHEGLEYGPAFRGAGPLRAGDREAVGQAALPDTLAAEAGRYGIHPALLDASLQLIGALFADGGQAGADPAGGAAADGVWLPVAAESFRVTAPGHARVTVHVTARDEADPGSRIADVRLYDDRGEPAAEVLGLRIRKASFAAPRPVPRDGTDDWVYELRWQPLPVTAAGGRTAPAPAEQDRWLILADSGGTGQALARELRQRGHAVSVAVPAAGYRHDGERAEFGLDPRRPQDFARLLADSPGGYGEIVYLWALDAADPGTPSAATPLACGGALHLAQALLARPGPASARLWLVTRGAQALPMAGPPPAPAQAPLWGLGRTLRTEHPDLLCMLIDLDSGAPGQDAETLLAEAVAADLGSDQIGFRGGERFAARLARPAVSRPRLPAAAGTHTARLVIPARGTLDSLTFEDVPRTPPAAGQVEIRVRASGLNFRDVLNALGAYPGPPGPLGLECAGEVCAVGEGVREFKPGDDVVALAPGSFSGFVTVPAALAARKPAALTYAEAATIPVSFLTAYYGLCELAHVTAGDTVLIHAAAGGLGLAAVQLALLAGAEVIGTAGSEAKRGYLRAQGARHVMRSRTLDFAAEVMDVTGGRGADIVLNSLAGDYIPRSLSCLAPNGRFVEAGKTGIWDTGQVTQARPDVSYAVLDLGLEAERDPAHVGAMLRRLLPEFERGSLRPLPRHVFGLGEATDSFRFMAQSRHIGKIVLTQSAGLSAPAPDRFRADAAYLITGGLGALGLRVARWMAGRGARHLALLGRRQPTGADLAAVAELAEAGADIRVLSADVADPAQLAAALKEIGASMPPLRGIVHAAGVLDDGILLRQDLARFDRVLAPKAAGAWNLHEQTRGLPLDFFVLFSSVAALWGTAGQGNYAAASAFLDALAHARRAEGLPALSINWGGWSQAGLAATDQAASQMSALGMRPIPPEAGVLALGAAMSRQETQLVIAPVDWAALREQAADGQIPPLLADLCGQAGRDSDGDFGGGRAGAAGLLRRLDAAAPATRRRVLRGYLEEQIRRTLGLAAQETLDARRPLNDYGLDSLQAIELRNTVGRAVGQTLPATVLFDYPAIADLASYLSDQVLGLPPGPATDGASAAGPSSGAAAAAASGDTLGAGIAEMSDDEAEAALAGEIAAVQALLDGEQR